MNDLDLIADADRRARNYASGISARAPYPDGAAIRNLARFDEPLTDSGRPDTETLALLDEVGSPATAATTGSRYFGYVVGGTLPIAAAAERLVLAWDQRASSFTSSPVAATVERIAGRWILEALDLPREAAVGFGTSATACTIACLATVRRSLLAKQGWNCDVLGLVGAPSVRVVASAAIHVAVAKALRILGFGTASVIAAPVDAFGQVDPARLPDLDERTILILQAGEVNTGACDPFSTLIPMARQAGAWTHVDGAFGLWAKASSSNLCDGVEEADSWTADGHKWLNTPYDCAFSICRDAAALRDTLSSDASYAPSEPDAQQNLTLEFSRRARGVAVWAALRSLGRDGIRDMVDRNIGQARRIGIALEEIGFDVPAPVFLNQVLARGPNDEATTKVVEHITRSGAGWFGLTRWQDRAAFRISLSSHATTDADVERLIEAFREASRSLHRD